MAIKIRPLKSLLKPNIDTKLSLALSSYQDINSVNNILRFMFYLIIDKAEKLRYNNAMHVSINEIMGN